MENQTKKIVETAAEFDVFETDYQLFRAEIEVNHAHCEALFHAGILTRIEAERIRNALQTIVKRAGYDKNYFSESGAGDVHRFVAARLVQLVGEAGKKVRVGRSDTEHKITTLRLWLRFEIEEILILINDFQSALVAAGEKQKNVIFSAIVGFDKTQIVLWAHWCLARFEMFGRDKERLDEVWRRANVSPFGAETSFEIDREEIAAALKFEGVSANGFDAVSDTDFAIEFCAACSILTLHLARIAEEITVYVSNECGLLEFINKNPFVQEKNIRHLELLPVLASRVAVCQFALLSANKIFSPLSDIKLLEVKKALFDTVETVKSCLQAAAATIKDISVNETKALSSAVESYAGGAELLDYLLKKDVLFETAKETVDKILEYAAAKTRQIEELSLTELRNFSPVIEEDIFGILKIEATLASKNQIGGTAPERVFEALEAARESLERDEV